MRPLRPGDYEADLAGLARLRRRVARDEEQPLAWKKETMKLCDQLHKKIDDVVTSKALNNGSPAAKKRKSTSTSGAAT